MMVNIMLIDNRDACKMTFVSEKMCLGRTTTMYTATTTP